MSKTFQKIFIWAALVSFLLAYNLWPFAWKGFFYQGMAVGLILLFALLREIKAIKMPATIGMWLAINNLMDELFFDPTKFEWNEYIVALIIILLIVRNGNKPK